MAGLGERVTEPLRVRALLEGAILLPGGTLALDALLAAAVALRDALPPCSVQGVTPIEVPIQREPGGRFHLASFAEWVPDEYEVRYVNRRFPIPEAQMLGDKKLRRIAINAGAQKSYRIPHEAIHVEGDVLAWWCVGDAEAIRELLALVTHLGKRRAVGSGRVREWLVEPCETWDGFPVMREGRPLRNLPPDWPGLASGVEVAAANLTYPYWERHREEVCAVPDGR